MEFTYAIVYVLNVSETIDFYENAFGFKKKFISPEGDYGELLTGQTTISFASKDLAQDNFSKGVRIVNKNDGVAAIELAFTSNDIEHDVAKAIKAGAELYEPIKEKPWGQKVGYLLDLNGFLIEICTPIN